MTVSECRGGGERCCWATDTDHYSPSPNPHRCSVTLLSPHFSPGINVTREGGRATRRDRSVPPPHTHTLQPQRESAPPPSISYTSSGCSCEVRAALALLALFSFLGSESATGASGGGGVRGCQIPATHQNITHLFPQTRSPMRRLAILRQLILSFSLYFSIRWVRLTFCGRELDMVGGPPPLSSSSSTQCFLSYYLPTGFGGGVALSAYVGVLTTLALL